MFPTNIHPSYWFFMSGKIYKRNCFWKEKKKRFADILAAKRDGRILRTKLFRFIRMKRLLIRNLLTSICGHFALDLLKLNTHFLSWNFLNFLLETQKEKNSANKYRDNLICTQKKSNNLIIFSIRENDDKIKCHKLCLQITRWMGECVHRFVAVCSPNSIFFY